MICIGDNYKSWLAYDDGRNDFNYQEMLVRVNAATKHVDPETGEDIYEIKEADRNQAEINHRWPTSLCWQPLDHPTKMGAHAMAICIFEKMVELGYVSNE